MRKLCRTPENLSGIAASGKVSRSVDRHSRKRELVKVDLRIDLDTHRHEFSRDSGGRRRVDAEDDDCVRTEVDNSATAVANRTHELDHAMSWHTHAH